MSSFDLEVQSTTMPERFMKSSRAYKQFKNPPQPHMCIQDTIKNTSEKLFINVLGWQKIANTMHNTDPIPLYGGMKIPRGCGPKNSPPSAVFAVMVNPEILKINGKNAENISERDALVSLLCDFVEAKNPGLQLSRNPVILKDRDLAGELKDVWHAVSERREREKFANQEITHKVYQIDIPPEQISNIDQDLPKYVDSDCDDAECDEEETSPEPTVYNPTMDLYAEIEQQLIDYTENCEEGNIEKRIRDFIVTEAKKRNLPGFEDFLPRTRYTSTQGKDQMSNGQTSTVCTPVYGNIMSTRENCQQAGENRKQYVEPTNVWETSTSATEKPIDPIPQYDFFPVFANREDTGKKEEPKAIETKTTETEAMKFYEDKCNMILNSIQQLALDPTKSEQTAPSPAYIQEPLNTTEDLKKSNKAKDKTKHTGYFKKRQPADKPKTEEEKRANTEK